MNTNEKLASDIHNKTCRLNHTDGCGWYYEVKDDVHDWSRSTHKRYLDKVISLRNFYTVRNIEIAIEIMAMIAGV